MQPLVRVLLWDGERGYQFRTLVALIVDAGSVPKTDMKGHSHV